MRTPNIRELAITVLGVVLAYGMINAALAGATMNASQPAASVRFWPGYAEAGAGVGLKRLAAGDVKGAARAADWALAREPLNVAALRTLALAKEKQGDAPAAEHLLRFAGTRSWRDTPTTAWLLQHNLMERRISDSIDDLDAMLRETTDIKLQTRLITLMTVAADLPAAVPPIVRQLALQPPWRKELLATLGGWRKDHGGANAVLTQLKTTRAPPTADEVAPYVNRLVSLGQYQDAEKAWRALSPSARPTDGLIHDADFASPADGTPFTWLLDTASSDSAEIGLMPDTANAWGLRVEYDGVSKSSMPRQLLLLPPGAYRITGTANTEASDTEATMSWMVICASNQQRLGQSSALGQTTGRVDFTLDVAPTAACPVQWLALVPTPGERSGTMVVWYSNFRIRQGAGAATPSPLSASLNQGAPQ